MPARARGGKPELALRFDLTVPLARYVAEHEHDLNFPFRRYQIQRVYRGERAQRGRFREFYQCDIDVIGKDTLSIRYDAEIPAVIYSVFRDLAIGPFTIWLNNRKIMRGFFEGLGIVDTEKQALALREVDKLDKRGAEYVRDTLTGEGFGLSADAAKRILDFVQVRSHGHADAIAQARCAGQRQRDVQPGHRRIARGADADQGVRRARNALRDQPVDRARARLLHRHRLRNDAQRTPADRLDLLGRPLRQPRDKLHEVAAAGRRHLDRRDAPVLAAARSEAARHRRQHGQGARHADGRGATAGLSRTRALLRNAGIATEVVWTAGKLGKQFKYADRAGIRFVVVLGPDEIAKGVVTVKDMRKEDQFEVARAELVKTLRVELEQAAVMKL